MTARLTTEEFVARARKIHGGRYDYSRVIYTNTSTAVEIGCAEHGWFKQRPNNHLTGYNCAACGDKATGDGLRSGAAEFVAKAREVHGAKYDYSKVAYTRSGQKVEIVCPDHGRFSQTANSHLSGNGCRKCHTARLKEKFSDTQEVFVAKARRTHGDRYEYSTAKYIGCFPDVEIVCKKHGKFLQSPHNHIRGQQCPKCAMSESKGEKAIADYLVSLGVAVDVRNRTVLAPKEIDIWLPEYQIGIEYHGLYWHTEDRASAVHRQKWELAQDAGVQLVQVFEDEWAEKQDAVKARLAALVGRSTNIMARKCQVIELSSVVARTFMETNHLQGAGVPARHYFGLEDAGGLVAVAIFGYRRGAWEVLRYASKGRVVGGFGRLLSRFRALHPGVRLISYCDLRYGTGRLYQTLGFTLEGVTEPDYWWVPRGEVRRVPRYQTQKHKLAAHPMLGKYFDPKLTEAEICEAAGWKRIHGVGHQKWVLTT